MTDADRYYPPGWRFQPNDEELVMFYLKNRLLNLPIPSQNIKDVNIYNYNPQQLYDMYSASGDGSKPIDQTMFFFTSRDRKYPNGNRPNRVANDGHGFWKASGVDKFVGPEDNPIGVKKSLVYYEGKHKGAKKTDWLMHEFTIYRKKDSVKIMTTPRSMKLDDLALCKIYKKQKKEEEDGGDSISSLASMIDETFEPEDPLMKIEPNHNAPQLPNSGAMYGPISQMLGDDKQKAVSTPKSNPNFFLNNGENSYHTYPIFDEVTPYNYYNYYPEPNQLSSIYPFSMPTGLNPDAIFCSTSSQFVHGCSSRENSFPVPFSMVDPHAMSCTSSQSMPDGPGLEYADNFISDWSNLSTYHNHHEVLNQDLLHPVWPAEEEMTAAYGVPQAPADQHLSSEFPRHQPNQASADKGTGN